MVKIDMFSGFLGAGKTTFIKKFLNACAGKNEKVVLIENEFGEIGIDGELVKRDGVEVYEISHGCICCTLKNDFIETLAEIIETIKPDRVIFEPSGVFVLSEVLDLMKLPKFYTTCNINSIVTIIDSVNYLKQKHKYSYFFKNQISHAGILILSKTQFVSAGDIAQISAELSAVNSHAEIVTGHWDDFSEQDILSLIDHGLSSLTAELLKDENETVHVHGHAHGHNHEFESFGIRTSKVFDKRDLENVLNNLSEFRFGSVIRGKGFLNTQSGTLEFSFVNGQCSILKSGHRPSGLVSLIGHGLNRQELLKYFSI